MSRKTIYNENATADWEKVSAENKKLVKEFLSYCKSNDRSPQTIRQYGEWLKVFFCWNYKENGDKFFVDLKKRDFVSYFGYLRDLGASPNRIATLKSALSSFSSEIELLYDDVYPTFKNQIRGLEPVHIQKIREKTVMSADEINETLKKLVDEKDYQTACFLSLVCSCGARKAELIQMKPSFFCPENEVFGGYMYKTPPIRSKGRGKTGKIINKYVIKNMFRPYFDLWIKERKAKGIVCDYLFVTQKDGKFIPATISTANGFARKISKVSGKDFYVHAGRHFFCTLLRSMDLPDDVIVQIFSWESADMVKIYDDTPVEEKMSKFFLKMKKEPEEAKGETENGTDERQ